VIIYVKNHGEERIGQEPDAPILLHYLNQHYIVITIDFENDPRAVSPFFDKDLHDLFSAIYGYNTTSLLEDAHLEPRVFRCFFLPAGCRVATDLVFWEIDKHGAYGTLEYIMDFYNSEIAGVVTGKERVSSPEEMTDRQGRPFQYKLAMDIVYPSKAKKKVPLVFYLSTQVTRHPNVAPSVYRPHTMGFTMRGYAYAIVDHCYNPIRRHFWHTPGRFSLDPWNGLAAYTAAIRFIRAHASDYNIDDRYIGGMGHSKGQYSVARLSDLHHAGKAEARQFEGQPLGSPEPQPWPGHSSRISVGYQSPGSKAEFITPDYVPTIVSHGEKDSHGGGYRSFFKRLEELDINHVALFMRGLGHELPYGYDEELGFDRYELVHKFFDQYLKVEEKLAPVVLFTTPRDQETDVAPSETISLQFAPVMDKESIVDGSGVKIICCGDGSPVEGSWSKSRQGTRFTFTAKEDFRDGEKYNVMITTNVKNEVGTHLDKVRIVEFTVGKNAVKSETGAAKNPAIVEIEQLGGRVELDGKSPDTVMEVDLHSTRATDADMERLKEFTNLRMLSLKDTQITDAGVEQLKALVKLEKVSLGGTRLSDAGLEHLKGMSNLEYLNLSGTQVTDAGLEHLKGLAKLRSLRLSGTGVTAGGVEKLRQALPNCDIIHRGLSTPYRKATSGELPDSRRRQNLSHLEANGEGETDAQELSKDTSVDKLKNARTSAIAATSGRPKSRAPSQPNLPASKTFSWDSPLLGKPISCEVYSPPDSSSKKPSVVYLKNLPSPRVGGTADETLISSFLEEGMLVFVADYEHAPKAVAPELLPELDKWYGFLYETTTYPVDKDWIYIVPEGYTIDRKVHICEFKGRPVGMDVIYPSDPAKPVPLVLQVTSTKERGKWINQRAYYIYGLLTTGYAGAIMDWNGTGPGAAPGGDVFPEKRAARLLRARAGDWNLSGRLGVTGHSKGSGRAGKAAFINEGDWEADRGPYAEKSDRFQVALLSAGQHAPEFLIEDGFHKPVRQSTEELTRVSTLTYVTPDDPPVFLSVGELDREFRVKQMKRLAARCEEVGVTYRLLIQKGMDHMYNPDPKVIGEIFSFFDKYLKPSPPP